jgi:NAD(P)-dependent dehydrogenase (short-subunit alcohol dehydrogenase family)
MCATWRNNCVFETELTINEFCAIGSLMGLLEGQVAIVTGAANGIGAAVARLFVRQGASVVANDVGTSREGIGHDPTIIADAVDELRAGGGSVVASSDDVTSRSGAENLLRTALDSFGRVDALVNCAGIQRDRALLNMDDETWRSVIDAHLGGTFNCVQAAAVFMRAQGRGHIVNTTSAAGLLGNLGQVNASAAAAGVYGVTRNAAIELQRYGITVNAVAPIAKTRQTEELPMLQKTTALSPDHVAPVYLFLASDLANDVTGQVLSVAGSRVAVYRMVESSGRFKENDNGIWTADEIAEQFLELSRV